MKAPKQGKATKRKLDYRYIEPKGSGFRGYWYDEHGKLKKGKQRETQLEAHQDALKHRKKFSVEHRGKSSRRTLQQAMDLALAVAERKGSAEDTIKNYKHRWKCLKQAWPEGKVALVDITRKQVQHFVDRSAAKGASPQSIKNDLQALGHVFNIAIKNEWVDKNPVRLVDRPSIKGNSTKKQRLRKTLGPLSRDDVTGFVDKARGTEFPATYDGGSDADILLLFWATGLRKSEVAGIQISEIHFDSQLMMVEEGKKRERELFIPDALAKVLRRMVGRALAEESAYLIPGKNKEVRRSKIRRCFERWQGTTTFGAQFKDTTIGDERIQPHWFRSATSSHMARCRVRNEVIAHVLGHDLGTQNITQLYVGVYGQDVQDAMECLWYGHEEWLDK